METGDIMDIKIEDILAKTRAQVKRIYEVGKEVPLGEDLTLWLQKLTPAEEKEALEHSYKPRAGILSLLKADPDEPGLLEFKDTLERWGLDTKEAQVNFLITPDVQKAQASQESKIASQKEWSENDYLITLQSAWNDGLDEKLALNPDDEEASRVFKELKRYTEQVATAVEVDRVDLFERMDIKSETEIEDKVVKMLIEHAAGQAQLNEFHAWAIYFATRLVEDHDVHFFGAREDIDGYGASLYPRLLEEYMLLSLDSIEGKE